MNIQDIGDVGNAPVPARVDMEIPEKTQEEISVGQEQPGTQHDEYVQSMNIIQDALYHVTDVRRDRIEQLRSQIHEKIYDPNSGKVAEKLLDIILPTGRKNLKVFREEE